MQGLCLSVVLFFLSKTYNKISLVTSGILKKVAEKKWPSCNQVRVILIQKCASNWGAVWTELPLLVILYSYWITYKPDIATFASLSKDLIKKKSCERISSMVLGVLIVLQYGVLFNHLPVHPIWVGKYFCVLMLGRRKQ